MTRLILKPGEERRLLAGHPWIFDNEIDAALGPQGSADLRPGEIVDVESSRKRYIGRAFVNPRSKIRARLFSPSKEGVDLGFFKRRIRTALDYRRALYDLERQSARIVFAEADFLPGLIIDRFVGWPAPAGLAAAVPQAPGPDAPGPETPASTDPAVAGQLNFTRCVADWGPPSTWLVCQFLTYGMDCRRDLILEALRELSPAAGIIERDTAAVRELEGLAQQSGLLDGAAPENGLLIFENGLPFIVDLLEGQKTGHFLDQVANRALAAGYAAGRRVLDACCHTGGFAIHAAHEGASEVVAVDSSAPALAAAERNIRLNGFGGRIRTVQANIFDFLRQAERSGEKYGLIILDPPAFAKSRSDLEGAERGYKEINLRALKLLDKGGILVSCSCSYALSELRLKQLVAEAAADAERRLRLMDFRYQAADHPILVGYDESLYLKCAFYWCI